MAGPERDLLKCECDANETRRALFHVYEAIKALPASFTKDYRIALVKAPSIVASETHPLKFLRCCGGDPWSAAARLCQNWTYRRQIFGDSHWLRPMRLQGALRPDDVALLRKGVFTLLTPPADAPEQRQVLIANFGLLQGQDPGMARKRVSFYLCNSTINEYTQRHGLITLAVIDGTGMKVSADNGKLFQATHNLSAFTIHKVILANDPFETRVTLTHLFGLFVRRLAEKFWGKDAGRLVNVAAPTPQATLQALEAEGLHHSIVPTQLGGTWSYETDWKDWLALRIVSEQSTLPPCPPVVSPVPMETRVEVTPTSSLNGNEHVAEEPPPVVASSGWGFPLPFLSRQQPTQMTTTTATTSQPPPDLPAKTIITNTTNNNENKNGTSKRGRKRRSDSSTSGPPLSTREVRKRNCEYSKRHYYKKKNEVKDLSDECQSLRRQQAALQAQNVHLTNLLQQAQTLVRTAEEQL